MLEHGREESIEPLACRDARHHTRHEPTRRHHVPGRSHDMPATSVTATSLTSYLTCEAGVLLVDLLQPPCTSCFS
jgi:hypothetical protein